MMNPMEAIKNWIAASSKQKKWVAGLCVVGVVATILLFSLTSSMEPTGSTGSTVVAGGDPLGSEPLYYAGVAAKLAGVLLLIVGGAVVLRRWQGTRLGGGNGRQLQLVETIRLTPKQALHLVQVGDQRLLIGATDEGISLLTVLETDVELQSAADEPAERPAGAFDFSALLGKSLRGDHPAGGSMPNDPPLMDQREANG